jgi:hypothetical protein
MGDFDTKQAEQRVGTIMGDCLGHYRKHLRWPDGDCILLLSCTCGGTARLFQSAGIAAASIDGTMAVNGTRRELLQRTWHRSAKGAHQLRTYR